MPAVDLLNMSNFRPQGKAEEDQGRTRRALTKEGDAQKATNERCPLGEILFPGFSEGGTKCRCSYSCVLFIMCFLGVFKCVKKDEHKSFQGLFPSQFITYLVFIKIPSLK